MAKKRTSTRRPRAGARPKVRVRMYRQGLGDCFLVTFDAGGAEKHMLIDCGTLGATTTGVTIADVVADIQKATGKHLHVLVATHEHTDHVSGFRSQQAAFEKFAIDHVWLAWTENPKDALAKKIVKHKNDLGIALAHAAAAMASARSSESHEAGRAVSGVLGFFNDGEALGAGTFSPTVDEAMEFVRTGVKAKPRYCNPGDGPFEEAWLDGFRVYVLGPPRDEKALYEMGEHGSSELYGIASGLNAGAAFFLSGMSAMDYARAADPAERAEFMASLPFDPRFRIERDSPSARQSFGDSYVVPAESWRSIDEDWLHAASDLALQLDNATNNTSLALAIERVADGKVLLFPADAQQGSWVSWHDVRMKWTVRQESKTRTVTAADLLARTVFYKVGHHSSHNATAKGRGLELMDQEDELTAFIPVDRAVALGRHPQGAWKMPARELYRRLLEKCQGRVARSDLGWADDAAQAKNKAVEKEFAGMATKAQWTAWKKSQKAAKGVTIDPLYVDYVLD